MTNPNPSVMSGSVTPTSEENPEFRVDDFVTMIVEAASGSDDVTTSGQIDSVVTVQDEDVSKLFVTMTMLSQSHLIRLYLGFSLSRSSVIV